VRPAHFQDSSSDLDLALAETYRVDDVVDAAAWGGDLGLKLGDHLAVNPASLPSVGDIVITGNRACGHRLSRFVTVRDSYNEASNLRVVVGVIRYYK
jgi:hypothetical protein